MLRTNPEISVRKRFQIRGNGAIDRVYFKVRNIAQSKLPEGKIQCI